MTGPSINEQDVLDAIKQITYTVLPDGLTTICQLTLDNGFTVNGRSACACVENFDATVGESNAYEDAKRQVWEFLGFRLKEQIAAGVPVVGVAPNGFGWALAKLREGCAVARAGWNGAGQFLTLQVPDSGSKMTLPYIYINTTSLDRVPWLASQTDMLANDWMVVA